MHDVGKLSVPDEILQKPAALDDEEFAVIQRHPERGRELLEELGGFSRWSAASCSTTTSASTGAATRAG